ncbi:Clavaminate synthase-like protein [Aaosphaeria arxii CBS 175.79]|uniref:Clavaminate synthase-like protein n=1 Tax=Aaosphaeria arxii CBS 175.79 TaxID=1450172 RepID=A0A6A5XER7_9PLEO|nr:Clavaminate synthase-like protein [Aaosphaeria arxii CBS 175.79]KAF2011341.1 Clavaminate synthase-like protein [Aaosphaeria arxii CBS 175.79]
MATTIAPPPATEHFTLDTPTSTPLIFEPFTLPSTNQRILGPPHPPNTVTPLALKPSTPTSTPPTLPTVLSTIRTLQKSHTLTQKLSQHGALLFRDLPITNATTFSQFAHAFGFSPHEIIGIVVDRPLLAPNVAPANEAPKDVLIYNHNESPQVPHAPGYIFFYAHRAPEVGGETPISSSLELFQRAREELPEFVEALASKGIRSRVTYKVDRQYEGGSTLAQAFGKEIVEGDDEVTRRAKIERQIARYGRGEHTTWEWEDGGDTLVVTHHLPAIRTQLGTGLPTLFTGLAAYYHRSVAGAEGEKRRNVTQQLYGDGTPIPEEYIKKLAEITEEIRVLHKWQRGDVLVYDNVIAQHGRQPWGGEQGDRVVLASLFDGEEVPGRYGSEGSWAQVVKALDD